MKSSSKISILMPVKNAGKFLEECLDSILDQTEQNWELIAVDDHSSDHSGKILKEYAAKYKRIQTFINDGQGIIPALCLAYSKSQGGLITRMDADDLMDPEKLQVMREDLLEAGPGHIALGLVEYFSDSNLGNGYTRYADWLNGLTLKGANFTEIYKECVIPSPCWMLHREDLEKCGRFDSNIYPEDYDLCFRFYEAGLKCLPSKQILHFWRDHPSRASRNDENYKDNRFLDLKLHYFLKLGNDSARPLVLWGAGDKGKLIAKDLVAKGKNFHWICNNPKKIGKSIHGQELESCEIVDSLRDPQIIVAVAGEYQNEIRKINRNYYFFC